MVLCCVVLLSVSVMSLPYQVVQCRRVLMVNVLEFSKL